VHPPDLAAPTNGHLEDDASTDDNTIRRCIGLARRADAGGIAVVNLFGYRSTDPSILRGPGECMNPIGPLNDKYIKRWVENKDVGKVIAAWGSAGDRHPLRVESVCKIIDDSEIAYPYGMYCYGVTSKGQPRHPLYVRNDALLLPWRYAKQLAREAATR
jgi:hypothetical protein